MWWVARDFTGKGGGGGREGTGQVTGKINSSFRPLPLGNASDRVILLGVLDLPSLLAAGRSGWMEDWPD